MRKTNLTKSKKSSGAAVKADQTRKSIPSRNRNAAIKMLVNGFADPKTSGKNTSWKDELERLPEMARQLDQAIQWFQAGNAEAAARVLERTVIDYPNHAPIYWYLGGIYSDLKMPARAIAHYQKATQLDPGSKRASLGLFNAFWDNDQVDEALEEMKRFQVLTNWSCREYVEILAEINEKWAVAAPNKKKTTRKK